MSLYPFFFDYERPRQCPRRLHNQHFGLGLTPEDELTIIAVPQHSRDYYRPWRNLLAAARDFGCTIEEDKDKFQVNVDVQHFGPEEISVKTIDGFLVIEAKHEEKQDEHGFVSRSFRRRYALPEGIDVNSVMSKLSSDGVLSITAPLKPKPNESNERVVQIVQSGRAVRKQERNKEEQG